MKKHSLLFSTLLLFILLTLSACNTNENDASYAEDKRKPTTARNKETEHASIVDSVSESEDAIINKNNDEMDANTGSNAENKSQSDDTSIENSKTDKENAPEVTDNTSVDTESANLDKEAEEQDAIGEIWITSGNEAIEYLKGQIEEGSNDDVSFGSDNVLSTDNKGSFYWVRLVSISLRIAGGTGTLDTYKVYQDGTYETYTAS